MDRHRADRMAVLVQRYEPAGDGALVSGAVASATIDVMICPVPPVRTPATRRRDLEAAMCARTLRGGRGTTCGASARMPW